MSADFPATPAFRVIGLPAAAFSHLFDLSDEALATHHVRRMRVDAENGFPDRVEMRDAAIGETVLLVNYAHLPDPGPFRSSHAIFVIEGATGAFDAVDRIPEVLRRRMLSLRAFDGDGMMIDADLVDGHAIEGLIHRFLADPRVDFVHVHYARRGCYACRIDRARQATRAPVVAGDDRIA